MHSTLKVTTTKVGMKGERILAVNDPRAIHKQRLSGLDLSETMSQPDTQRTMRFLTKPNVCDTMRKRSQTGCR